MGEGPPFMKMSNSYRKCGCWDWCGGGRESWTWHMAAVFKPSKAHMWEEEGGCSENPRNGKKSKKREVKIMICLDLYTPEVPTMK